MENKKVNFIVTDLDDTIWDWLGMWHGSFEPYLNRISKEFNIDIEELKKDFKKIHQKYHTTEASFRFNELITLKDEEKEKIKSDKAKKSIYHEYNSNKKNCLKLYDGVLDTLNEIKSKGTIIVGFTESSAFFTKYRLKHLKLDGIIDCIYAPIGADVPPDLQVYNPDYWEPEITEIRYLSQSIKKPNKEILEIILADFKAKKSNTIYIGDKLDRDINMAQQADITSVYAKYGHLIEDERYQLLRDVTHWTDEDVEREKSAKQQMHLSPPDFTLHTSFSEIIPLFSFVEYPNKLDVSQVSNVVNIWKEIVGVQQHFNDIELRVRNYALTALTFIIAGVGFLEKEHLMYEVYNVRIPAGSVFALIGVLIIAAFYFMDKYWYHNFLKGAVNEGTRIENRWSKELPELGLTKAISKASPSYLFKKKLRSDDKYYVFYGLLAGVLILLSVILFVINFKG